jgi:hypothetical protein
LREWSPEVKAVQLVSCCFSGQKCILSSLWHCQMLHSGGHQLDSIHQPTSVHEHICPQVKLPQVQDNPILI